MRLCYTFLPTFPGFQGQKGHSLLVEAPWQHVSSEIVSCRQPKRCVPVEQASRVGDFAFIIKLRTTALRRLHEYRSTNRSRSVVQPVQSRHTCDQSGEARMRRREFAKLVAATVAWPAVAGAQKA